MKLNARQIAINAFIATLYAVFTIMITPISYGNLQLRLSEIMVFLAFYQQKYIPGLVLGCLLANILSPLGWIDMVFGTFSTLLVCVSMYHIRHKYRAAFVGALITGIVIGLELKIVFGIGWIWNFMYVAIGELIVLFLGAIIFTYFEKNEHIKKFLDL